MSISFTEYDDQLEEKKLLNELINIEKDVIMLNEIFKDFNHIISQQIENINNISNKTTEINNIIDLSNKEIKKAIEIKKNIIIISSIGLIFLNTPIAITFGLNSFISSSVISSAVLYYYFF